MTVQKSHDGKVPTTINANNPIGKLNTTTAPKCHPTRQTSPEKINLKTRTHARNRHTNIHDQKTTQRIHQKHESQNKQASKRAEQTRDTKTHTGKENNYRINARHAAAKIRMQLKNHNRTMRHTSNESLKKGHNTTVKTQATEQQA